MLFCPSEVCDVEVHKTCGYVCCLPVVLVGVTLFLSSSSSDPFDACDLSLSGLATWQITLKKILGISCKGALGFLLAAFSEALRSLPGVPGTDEVRGHVCRCHWHHSEPRVVDNFCANGPFQLQHFPGLLRDTQRGGHPHPLGCSAATGAT